MNLLPTALGKIVQTIAVLLHRAKKGPAIVVAPTSVCGGWIEQGQKFAPTLRWLAPTKKEQLSEKLKTNDVIVLSYNFLTLYIDNISDIEFATVVLDEAQAIKNAKAKRTLAVCKIKGDFRLATTGTPIENHLGELWSLMNFLNPGLLGTAKKFETKYGRNIQKDTNSHHLTALQSLIRPFVLWRKKADVVQDLPQRTEIVVEITPSEQELAFMEALRRRALTRINQQDNSKSSAITLLAELTRLRQAACHPILVEPEISIESSKLRYLMDLTQKLIENQHRILIFSQFVSFLTIIKGEFKKQEISFQYLDGSTPRKDRESSISHFQQGLNLTAADYVIHLDPWWNPAIEDQASSRAHRIGQQNPVTVYKYKLVTKGSIEEKVYALHEEKRDLAEKVLMSDGSAQAPDIDKLYSLLSTI